MHTRRQGTAALLGLDTQEVADRDPKTASLADWDDNSEFRMSLNPLTFILMIPLPVQQSAVTAGQVLKPPSAAPPEKVSRTFDL